MDESKLYHYRAKVTNVVDGDTIDCIIDCGFRASLVARLRLLGVNCPEVHGATKEAGLVAAAFTRATLLGKDVMVRTEKSDVFGRWLAKVWLDGADFNASLLEQGFAAPFRPS